ncbi:hypothetical protein Dimus_015969, partial [Dionaea muscipula]
EKRKGKEQKQKGTEPERTVSKEPRSKRKHDVNAIKSSDEPLSEWMKKAKQGEDGSEKSTPEQKKVAQSEWGSTRRVDPSVKKKNVNKKKTMKRGKQPEAPASSKSSESESDILPYLPNESIEGKKVIRGKFFKKSWLLVGLNNLLEMIHAQGWDKLFAKWNPIYQSVCREFYKNLLVKVMNRTEIAISNVHGVDIQFDGMTLASILGIPRNTRICICEGSLRRFCALQPT